MATAIEALSSKESVLKAIEEYKKLGRDEFLKQHEIKRFKKYTLHYNGEKYDIRGIAARAYREQHGYPFKGINADSGTEKAIQFLKDLGFEIVETPHPFDYLTEGKLYTRKALIELYGGQLQGGIWTPREFPVIFIFTGESGETYGYKDGWTAEGSFSYTGEGQKALWNLFGVINPSATIKKTAKTSSCSKTTRKKKAFAILACSSVILGITFSA
ncbi:hypothetical protein QEP77_20460 [Serratia sp. B1]|nr:hypothetical protein QEP77_20460 [Serratia sp. B1]